MTYDFKTIEQHAQNKKKPSFSLNEKPFYYIVPMFPYPSGNIHMGHIRNYSISNVIARYKKSKGFNVLHPIGFDSFGLPAEAAAIKNQVTPKEWTQSNIEKMVHDFKMMGFDFDWDNIVKTHEFDYYKFEQDIFKRAFKEGFIYKKEQFVNYDPVDCTILSNEQVIDGKGWRSGAMVVRKKMPMYFFNIRKYAHELNAELDNLSKNWPKRVIEMQRNWIGLDHGQNINFEFKEGCIDIFLSQKVKDVNAVVIGINHPFVDLIQDDEFKNWVIETSKGSVSQKNNFSVKQWFDTGRAVNYQGQTIPIFIDINKDEECVFVKDKNSISQNFNKEIGQFKHSKDADFVALKDWCISRQRYWGNPIPMIECVDCGDVPSEDYVQLPNDLKPNGQGNVLDKTSSFYQCVCPNCGNKAKRVCDTMDTFVQSSWYYHRYINPQSSLMIPKEDNQIDTYIGGVEHATMHLIYTRFFHKMLRDFGMITTNEPIKKLITQGMVCKKYQKKDGSIASAKMSKSLGNIVAPQEYIDKYGADALQMFIIFAAPPGDNFDFEDAGIVGSYRFLEEVYSYFFGENKAQKNKTQEEAQKAVEKLISYVEREFEGRGNLNTVIPQLMIAFKDIKKCEFIDDDIKKIVENKFVDQLGIFAPHLAQYIHDFVFDCKQELKNAIMKP